MTRRVLLLALVASCDAPVPPVEAPPPHWVYEPAPTAWPLGEVRGRFGRAQAPQPVASLGIAGTERVPLRLATLWEVPGSVDKPARAAVYGLEGAKPAIELIEIDAGRVVWRQRDLCTGPIVGVTEEAIVCSDGTGVRGVTLDGKTAWRVEVPFVAMSDDRVVVAAEGEAVILDATSGDELSRVKVPAGASAETVVASCGDAGRELFLATADKKLVRVADVKGKPAITWSAPLGLFMAIDPCIGGSVVAHADRSLVAFARDTGAQTGRIDGVRGFWPARDGDGIEVATIGGVTRWTRDLATSGAELNVPLGALLGSRGERRLVRATPSTAVVLDRAGVVAYVQIGDGGAVLGDTAIIASAWTGSQANTPQRFALPAARYPRVLRLPLASTGLAVTTELRDLPAAMPLAVDAAIAKPDTGKQRVGPIAIDPLASNIVYVAAAEHAADDDSPQTIAAIDLVAKSWLWQRSDACGGGEVRAIAVVRDAIACATQGARPGTALVRATSRDGVPRWEWEGEGVDALAAIGSLVLVTSGARTYALDAISGQPKLTVAGPVALVDTPEWGTLVIAVEHGRLVARGARLAMLPVWTLGIDGVATAVHAAGDAVLVQLEDGDAYRVAFDGTITGVPGIGLEWHAGADLLAGLTAGGGIFGPPLPPAPVKRGVARAAHRLGQKLLAEDPEMPTLWTPIPPPPVIAAARQLTIYDPTGGVRARAEYDLGGASAVSPRGPAGSPIVLVTDREAVVIDPRTADPLRRVALPTGAHAFATIVNGSPVAGVMLADPLRAVLF